MGELASYRALVRRPGARTVFLPDTSEFEMTRREEDGRGRCFLCEAACDRRCEACGGKVYFCCDDHRDLHRPPSSALECYPFAVVSVAGVGRALVATRDVAAGELVFEERPLTVGPLHDTPPVCLGCFDKTDGSFECRDCGLPMCGERCAKENSEIHKSAECGAFAARRLRESQSARIADFSSDHPLYQCITPLRCLALKRTSPQHWRAMTAMMDHESERSRDSHWEVEQNNTVRFIRERLGLDFSEREINHVIGLLEVNAFEVTGRGRGRGVFPLTALMSHCCISNTRYTMYADHHVECRANVAIRKGEEITDHYVSPLFGTMYRRSHLRDGWYFDCKCPRCQDPGELGTHLDAFRCDSCPEEGRVTSPDPTDYASDFRCDKCEKVFPRATLVEVEEELLGRVEGADKSSDAELEGLLRECLGRVSPTSHVVLALKRHLVYVYGRTPGRMLHQLPPELVSRKRELCEDLMAVLDVITPGLTKERGLTLFELASVILFRADKEEGPGGLKALRRCEEILGEAVQCLRHERPETFEHFVMLAAKKQLRQCADLGEMLRIMQH